METTHLYVRPSSVGLNQTVARATALKVGGCLISSPMAVVAVDDRHSSADEQ